MPELRSKTVDMNKNVLGPRLWLNCTMKDTQHDEC